LPVLAGVSRDTVRLYTRLGLVTCTSRRAGSRLYADYDASAVKAIKAIKVGQSIGFTLSKLGPIAAAYIALPRRRPAARTAGRQAGPD
jgi:MerR family transcriptional regulator, copper efflux regulator